jgi:hypothetical protein
MVQLDSAAALACTGSTAFSAAAHEQPHLDGRGGGGVGAERKVRHQNRADEVAEERDGPVTRQRRQLNPFGEKARQHHHDVAAQVYPFESKGLNNRVFTCTL